VNKEQLLDLTERLRLVAGVELTVIVGSQSLYAVTSYVPGFLRTQPAATVDRKPSDPIVVTNTRCWMSALCRAKALANSETFSKNPLNVTA
jgi:hypothetical protein